MTNKKQIINTFFQRGHRRLIGRIFVVFISALVFSVSFPYTSYACVQAQSCSAGYEVNEVFFGNGGALNDCFGSYCAKESIGETGVGNTGAGSYQAQAGFNTDRSPSLTFIVNAANINLGKLTIGTTATTNATFSVKSYLSSGYVVQTDSPPPQNSTYTLHSLSTAALSNPSAEQFGMNLVSNTTACGAPTNFGSNPIQVPSSVYGYGQAASGYNTCGYFQYNNGDVIADSTESSGETDYTISYIFNITNLTPGGVYTFNQVLVATSTF